MVSEQSATSGAIERRKHENVAQAAVQWGDEVGGGLTSIVGVGVCLLASVVSDAGTLSAGSGWEQFADRTQAIEAHTTQSNQE